MSRINGRVTTRGTRHAYTERQSKALESAYKEMNYLTPERKEILASMIGIHARHIVVWFQNRRTRDKKAGRGEKGMLLSQVQESDYSVAVHDNEQDRRVMADVGNDVDNYEERSAVRMHSESSLPPQGVALPVNVQVTATTAHRLDFPKVMLHRLELTVEISQQLLEYHRCKEEQSEDNPVCENVAPVPRRHLFATWQYKILRDAYNKENYISQATRSSLSASLNLDERQIQKWFENRRGMDRKAGILPTGKPDLQRRSGSERQDIGTADLFRRRSTDPSKLDESMDCAEGMDAESKMFLPPQVSVQRIVPGSAGNSGYPHEQRLGRGQWENWGAGQDVIQGSHQCEIDYFSVPLLTLLQNPLTSVECEYWGTGQPDNHGPNH